MKTIFIDYQNEYWSEFTQMPNFDRHQGFFSEIEQAYFIKGILITDDKATNSYARVACYINPYHKINGTQALTFGYFETVNNIEVFRLIWKAIVQLTTQHNLTKIIGPINGNTWNAYRFKTKSEYLPFLMEPYNPIYYPQFLSEIGAKELTSFVSYSANSSHIHYELYEKNLSILEENGIRFTNVDFDNLEEELSYIYEICMDAFKSNFLFSPISSLLFKNKMRALLSIANKESTFVARYNEKIIGFIYCYDQLLNDKKGLVIKTLARRSDDKFTALGSVLASKVIDYFARSEYEYLIYALIHTTNKTSDMSVRFGGNNISEYKLYQFDI